MEREDVSMMSGEAPDVEVDVVESAMETVNEIAGIGGECRSIFKKDCANLVRRIKLLTPMFEELKEVKNPLGKERLVGLKSLMVALQAAKELLKLAHDGSKLFPVVEIVEVEIKFREVTTQLEQALGGLSYEELELSDEVREQVEFVHAQFNRAKDRADTFDSVIPDDFRCPISLDLMKDPVIVATGQTYERASIQKWLDSGHSTCPTTRQMLPKSVLTPNYALRNLIRQWCETNGIELSGKSGVSASDNSVDRATIVLLLQKLFTGLLEDERAAASKLRLLAMNADNRIRIAVCGAIPLLVNLLNTRDAITQEHAITALFNLSIHEDNKRAIVRARAIVPILNVLKRGSMEARENAAATLFSLSVVDENKEIIGASGAILALVGLLREGSQRGKKEAATALFNLSICHGNRRRAVRAVRAGVVGTLMQLLLDPSGEMVDEALALLSLLASHKEGKTAIENADAIPILVNIIRTGSPHNRENAATILLALCTKNLPNLVSARNLGADVALSDLAQNGRPRAKRKAAALLKQMNRYFSMDGLELLIETYHQVINFCRYLEQF